MFWPSFLLLACSSWPVQADLSWLTFQTALPDSPVPAVWHAVLPRLPFPVVLPCCPATAIHLRLSFPGYPILAVLRRLSCPGCPVPSYTIYCCHVLVIVFSPSCLAWLFPADLSGCLVPDVLSWLSCPRCSIPRVLSLLSCSCHPVPNFQSWLYYSYCPFWLC